MEGIQQHTPERSASPIFEPECPTSSVPIAIMVAPPSTKNPKSPTPEVVSISPYTQRLLDIETRAKLAIMGWNAGGVESMLPAKRKGMCFPHLRSVSC